MCAHENMCMACACTCYMHMHMHMCMCMCMCMLSAYSGLRELCSVLSCFDALFLLRMRM